MLYEGVLTFGILPTSEEDPKLLEFLRKIVLIFELMYTKELHQDAILERKYFEEFRPIVKKMYSEMVEIDTKLLYKIMVIMKNSTFTNYIIYETEFFHPVFKAILELNLNFHADRLTQVFRHIMDFGLRINQNFISGEFNFEEITMHTLKTPSHCIAIFNTNGQRERESIRKEINQLKRKIWELN